jgi:hypothetical protein
MYSHHRRAIDVICGIKVLAEPTSDSRFCAASSSMREKKKKFDWV